MDNVNTDRSQAAEYDDDCGSFNLMAGFAATNNTTDMSAVETTDADRNGVDATGSSNLDNNDMQHAAKRNKIDKDGFVTPATPDFSIHMHHYPDSDNEMKTHSAAESGLAGDDEVDEGGVPSESEGREDIGQMGGETAALGDAGEVGTDDMDSLATSCTSLTQLLREFGQRAKMLNTDWSYAFNDSENFESFCVTRLDKMLEDARALEADLLQQKEGLREKLLDLSRTLQLD